jgi:hypothetical protein
MGPSACDQNAIVQDEIRGLQIEQSLFWGHGANPHHFAAKVTL